MPGSGIPISLLFQDGHARFNMLRVLFELLKLKINEGLIYWGP